MSEKQYTTTVKLALEAIDTARQTLIDMADKANTFEFTLKIEPDSVPKYEVRFGRSYEE